MKSSPPKNMATTAVIPNTINVYLKMSFCESQLTLFISTQTSLKNKFIFCVIFMVFKMARRPSTYMIAEPN